MFSLLIVTIVVSLLVGCFGGGPVTPKTYSLAVTVLNDSSGTPLAGASVEVVGASMQSKTTNANGQATFSGLKGTVEVLVEFVGYTSKTESVQLDKNESITVRLETAEGTAVVHSEEEFADAVSDSSVNNLVLVGDVILSESLVINRPLNMNLNGYDITGNLEFEFEDEVELTLVGSGSIAGDLSVAAPNASVENYITVSGTINILEVASETWHEHAQNNRLVVCGPNVRLCVHDGASSIEIAEGVWDVRVDILDGQVEEFIANLGAHVRVNRADKIVLAIVNSPQVTFDVSPQQVEGDFEPIIIQSFVPGSGGTIPEFTPSMAPPETFSGLYVERNHRWPSLAGGTSPEVDMYFTAAQELGGTGYALQYLDTDDLKWKSYHGFETSSATSNNFSISYAGTTSFRLLMIGGPMDGYTSNEVTVTAPTVPTYFSYRGLTGFYPYLGETFVAEAAAQRISDDQTVSPIYLGYQWYRVDPVTYEMEAIAGATSRDYEVQEEDIGHALLFRADGDGINIGGFTQIWVPWSNDTPQTIKYSNKAFISDVTSDGFILNLYMNVPAALSPDDLELYAYGPSAPSEPLQIESVSFVPGSQSRLVVAVDIPETGITSLWLTGGTVHWGIVSSNYGHGFIQPNVVYDF